MAIVPMLHLLFIRSETATAALEESGPFADIDDDKDEMEDSEVVLVHVHWYSHALLQYDVVHEVCSCVHMCYSTSSSF